MTKQDAPTTTDAAQAVRPLPTTAEEVRDFIGSHYLSLTFGNPRDGDTASVNDVYEVTAHDLLSAFRWWDEDRASSAAAQWISVDEWTPDSTVSVLGFWPPSEGPVHAGCYATVAYVKGIWVNPEDEDRHYRPPSHVMSLPAPPAKPADTGEAP